MPGIRHRRGRRPRFSASTGRAESCRQRSVVARRCGHHLRKVSHFPGQRPLGVHCRRTTLQQRPGGRRFKTAPSGAVPLFFGPLFGWKEFETAAQSTVVRVDRDIVLIVDRSSSMKLPINHPTGNMSTRDPRFPLPPQADSRWVSLQGAVQEFVDALAETPQVENLGLVSYASDYHSQGVNNRRPPLTSSSPNCTPRSTIAWPTLRGPRSMD